MPRKQFKQMAVGSGSEYRWKIHAGVTYSGVNIMQKRLARNHKTQRGATAIEYGLIVGLIALGIVVGAGQLGTGISTGFGNLATRITNLFATNNGGGS